jgi:hypothetical protein
MLAFETGDLGHGAGMLHQVIVGGASDVRGMNLTLSPAAPMSPILEILARVGCDRPSPARSPDRGRARLAVGGETGFSARAV